MIIDTHAHFAPQPMLDALVRGAASFPNVELLHEGDIYKLAFAGNPPTRPLAPKLRETGMRREFMDENGIDHQVTGGWLDSFGYELPPDEGAAWSRFVNAHLKEGTGATDILTPLASVPLQSGKLAAEILRETLAEGFPGVMIGTQPHGSSGNLDDPDLDPFWETASELGAAIYIHPMFGCGDPRLLDYDMINAVGRGVDTTTAVARMLFSGHFLRYPGMKVVLSHGGAALPVMLARLQRNVVIHDGYADPTEQMKRLFYDTVVFDPDVLRFLHRKFGASQLMLGSDYPFPIGDPKPCHVVHAAELSEIDTRAILGDNAAKLFRIG